ncbi:MAG: MoaD/ThiS family protein [Candidatus Binatus sp.]|uniref:MoaD/ThiS family protein n=1 Tax=Candidatus Binatus sp. TaxID=2811406 RepID=UPI002715CDB4|nr:MoaD/ThiS family protein [Candidatus Binatus sp.]MDO8432530.1 MoaD/ThiS family protein [Candidatus Binatus sp.]
MRVTIPSPLRSYTQGRSEVDTTGNSFSELLSNLDTAFPGIRFRMIDEQDRIRRHIRFFVNREQVTDLAQALRDDDEVQILCALSGG